MRKSKRILAFVLALIMFMSVIFTSSIFNVSAKDFSSYKVGSTFTFGSYPQTKVTNSSTISALNKISKSWKSYGYYSGTGEGHDGKMKPSNFMKYADISYNGSKYRAVTFSSYRPECTGSKLNDPDLYDGLYSQYQNGYYKNNVYYFKYEPLIWKVLDPKEGFVMCNKVIDSQAFSNVKFYSGDECYNSINKDHYASDWSTSSIRKWLNNDFYNTAFNSTEKMEITISHIDNKEDGERDSEYDGVSTYDKIYLLSYEDVINPKYGFNSDPDLEAKSRQAKATDYAKCQGCWTPTNKNYDYYGNAIWCLRSPYGSYGTGDVYYDGGVSYSGTDCSGSGTRPALKFNLKSTIPSTTKLSSISNTTSGIKITWEEASGTSIYNIYRKTSPSDPWKKLADTTNSLSYTDKTVKAGTKYYYTVRGINNNGNGGYEKDGLSIVHLTSPTVTLTNSTNGVNINWNKISGVDGYYIYRKTKNGTYSMIKQITSAGTVSYQDKEVKDNSGTEYVYAVRAYKDTDRSGYTGVNIIRLTNPVVKASNASAGMNVKWEKVTGAKGYYVYRTNSAGKYERIATVSGGDTLSYQDKAVKSNNGTKYQYTVRAYNGSYASSYTGVTNIRLTTNSISSLTNDTSNTITVKYTKNDKASGYQIQYSLSSTFASGNTSVKTTSTSKAITGLTKGATYYVRVRAYRTVGGVNYYAGWTGTKSVKIAK